MEGEGGKQENKEGIDSKHFQIGQLMRETWLWELAKDGVVWVGGRDGTGST